MGFRDLGGHGSGRELESRRGLGVQKEGQGSRRGLGGLGGVGGLGSRLGSGRRLRGLGRGLGVREGGLAEVKIHNMFVIIQNIFLLHIMKSSCVFNKSVRGTEYLATLFNVSYSYTQSM